MINLKPRKPDEVIGEKYMRRWHLRRKHGGMNLYLHRYEGSDDDRALHDHPWRSVSVLLWGRLTEVTPKGDQRLWWFLPKFRKAEYAHRVALDSKYAFTLFLTFRKEREWGFHCPKGWVHWKDFTSSDGQQTGVGCGENTEESA